MKKILIFIFTFIFTLFIIACGAAEIKTVDNTKENEISNENSNTADDTEQEEINDNEVKKRPEFYSVDETISIDGLEISVDPSWGTESEYLETEKGNVLRVEVTAVNNSDENIFIFDDEFRISDAEDNMLENYFGNDDAFLFSAEIKKGKKAKGAIEFDAPDSDFFEIYYEPSFTFKYNSEVIWKVDSSEIE